MKFTVREKGNSMTIPVPNDEVLQKRIKYNNMLLRALKKYVRDNPSFKFIQILHALNIINGRDNWSEEPEITYKRVLRMLEQQKIMRERINDVKQ